jgi:hypothetical protein
VRLRCCSKRTEDWNGKILGNLVHTHLCFRRWHRYGKKTIVGFSEPRYYDRCAHCDIKRWTQVIGPGRIRVTYLHGHNHLPSPSYVGISPRVPSLHSRLTSKHPCKRARTVPFSLHGSYENASVRLCNCSFDGKGANKLQGQRGGAMAGTPMLQPIANYLPQLRGQYLTAWDYLIAIASQRAEDGA